jgi:glycerophosphoryl diester phosphodiesterase
MDKKYTANTDPLLKEIKWWVVLLLLCLVCAAFSQVKYANASTEVSLPSGFDLQAHRGGRDARPENTLPAFAYALALGVTTLELDVQITGDGAMVVWHNKSIPWYMAKNGWGKFIVADEQPDIRYWKLADLKSFDLGVMSPDAPYGYWQSHGMTQKKVPGTTICTLEEVFKLVKDWGNNQVFLNVETKSDPYPVNPANPEPAVWVTKFYDLVVKYELQNRVMLQSFDWRALREMKKLDPRIATVALTANQPSWNAEGDEGDYQWIGRGKPSPWMAGLDIRDFDNNVVLAAHAIGADVISTDHTEVTQQTIADAHKRGMRIVPFTVNSPGRMRELILMGVDGIITDRPSTLRAVCEELGIATPPPDPDPVGKPYYSGLDGL